MRQKKVFPTDEVAHIWSKQSQTEGRNAGKNLFFNGDKIYSYGHHFCIARMIDNNRVLFTTRRYSVTTSSHMYQVQRAITHKELVYCNDPSEGANSNILAFGKEMHEQYLIIQDTKRRKVTHDKAKLEIVAIAERVDKYLAAINTSIKIFTFDTFVALYAFAKDQDLSKLQSTFEAQKLEAQRRELAQENERREKAKKEIAKWKRGANIRLYYHVDEVYLRFNASDNVVETSHGARVNVKQAKILFERIKSGKDVIGFVIDGYTVLGLNGVLTIGCHKIERKEINLFAKKMGWGQINTH
ncbi:MAG TPA: hypothetical protein VL443_24055 [Cyclobacteriaceae bacterium]|jgi:hypothetical protein|nr:hypothetical protein [Cyclobacteriaceae bacterium]